jgi:YVTN family beta-propeller protein
MMMSFPAGTTSAGGTTRPSPARQHRGMVRTVGGAPPRTEVNHAVVVPPTVPVGRDPAGLAFEAVTHTLYVTNAGNDTVSVIDTAACNATISRTCHQHPHLIRLPAGADAQGIELDTATSTAYVADIGTNTISVINTRTCNATDSTGCRRTPASIKDPDGPMNLGVNQRTDTVYVANFGTTSRPPPTRSRSSTAPPATPTSPPAAPRHLQR